MKGPLARIRRRKTPATAPGEQPTSVLGPQAAPPPADAQPPAPEAAAPSLFGGTPPSAAPPPTEQTMVLGVPGTGLPADVKPEEVGRPGFRDRGRLRRRLRYLRRVRELGFRDLGGLVFDLDRFGRQGEHLVRGKLAALRAVDSELRALERALDERRDVLELREPGIAACPKCGALHGSDARFCPSCGVGLRGPRAVSEVANVAFVPQAPPTAPPPPASEQPTVQQTPPAPAPEPAPPPEPEPARAPEPEPAPAPEPEPAAASEPPAAGEDLSWEQPVPPPADRSEGENGLSWEEQPTEILRPSDQADKPQ